MVTGEWIKKTRQMIAAWDADQLRHATAMMQLRWRDLKADARREKEGDREFQNR
jgi:hypothetical protein